MASIKGPRSALTDFIEENNIKIQSSIEQRNNKLSPKRNEVVKHTKQIKRKTKRIKKQMPVESINIDIITISDEDMKVKSILTNFDNIDYLEDKQLRDISSYLSRSRIYNQEYITKIIALCTDSLVIYDCSEIKDENYEIYKELRSLELYQCGQLTSLKINSILKKQGKLEVLRLTGGYLLTELELPKSLKVLDLTNCSRLDDRIIDEINKKYNQLDELRFSFCYKITGFTQLNIEIERLYLCETNITEDFIFNIPNIENVKSLSLKRCPLINNIPIEFKFIEYLDIEGITEIKNLNACYKLKVFNCKQCFNLLSQLPTLITKFESLEILNISYLPIKFSTISQLNNLKELDISWCPSVNDTFICEILESLKLDKLYVFGCFNLSPKISESSWNNNKTKVLGNPAETKYLIMNG